MFFELVWVLFAIVPDYGNEYMTKGNNNWTSFKNFAPKLDLNHNIYQGLITCNLKLLVILDKTRLKMFWSWLRIVYYVVFTVIKEKEYKVVNKTLTSFLNFKFSITWLHETC